MPVYDKNQIIKAYGHLFILCGVDDQGRRYQMLDMVENFDGIGGPDTGWRLPRSVKNLEIVEVFGMTRAGGVVTEGIAYDAWKLASKKGDDLTLAEVHKNAGDASYHVTHDLSDKSVFRTLEAAQEKAAAFHKQYAHLYERLREIGKTTALDFDTTTPEMKIGLILQPDKVEFPEPITPGTKLYGFFCNPMVPMGIFETEVRRADLTLGKGYELTIHFDVSADGEKKWGIERTLRMYECGDGPGWRFAYLGPQQLPPHIADFNLYPTKDTATLVAGEFARRVVANMEAFMNRTRGTVPMMAVAERVPGSP